MATVVTKKRKGRKPRIVVCEDWSEQKHRHVCRLIWALQPSYFMDATCREQLSKEVLAKIASELEVTISALFHQLRRGFRGRNKRTGWQGAWLAAAQDTRPGNFYLGYGTYWVKG